MSPRPSALIPVLFLFAASCSTPAQPTVGGVRNERPKTQAPLKSSRLHAKKKKSGIEKELEMLTAEIEQCRLALDGLDIVRCPVGEPDWNERMATLEQQIPLENDPEKAAELREQKSKIEKLFRDEREGEILIAKLKVLESKMQQLFTEEYGALSTADEPSVK